jgi:hypothetical protein
MGERFQLIAGERRWRAFQLLKIRSIPARIVEASDASAASIGLIENLQREGLNPIEEAHGFASLVRDFDLTQETAAERVGKSRAAVANSLRLLSLDPEIQGYIAKDLLSVGHAKALLGDRGSREADGPGAPGDRGGPQRPAGREAGPGCPGAGGGEVAGPRAVPRRRATRRQSRASRRGSPRIWARAWR